MKAEAIVIEVLVADPALGSHNRLTMFDFDVQAERVPPVPLLSPRLAQSEGMQVLVADEVVTPERPLQIRTTGHEAALIVSA